METPIFVASYVLLWLIVLLQSTVVIALIRRVSLDSSSKPEWSYRVQPLDQGSTAPEFAAMSLHDSSTITSKDFQGKRILLGFVTAGCVKCDEAVAQAPTVAKNYSASIVLLCGSTKRDCQEHFSNIRIDDGAIFLFDEGAGIAGMYGVYGAPVFVLVDSDWRIEKYGAPHDEGHLETISTESQMIKQ